MTSPRTSRIAIRAVRSSAKLKRSGLTPVRLSYANMFLFPVAVAKRLSERLFSPHQTGSDLTLDPGPLNGVLRSILSAEAPLVSTVGLPFGLTVVALARKDSYLDVYETFECNGFLSLLQRRGHHPHDDSARPVYSAPHHRRLRSGGDQRRQPG